MKEACFARLEKDLSLNVWHANHSTTGCSRKMWVHAIAHNAIPFPVIFHHAIAIYTYSKIWHICHIYITLNLLR